MSDLVTLTMNPAIDVSAVTEELRAFSKLRCTDERRDAGGGGINVARVAKRLGADPLAIFPAGGPTGDLLTMLVKREAVRGKPIAIQQNTREDFTVTERKTQRQFRFVLPGALLSEAEWRACLNEMASTLSPSSLLVASGSLPPGVPPDFYGVVADAANAAGAKLLLDSSGESLRPALGKGVHLIKPNLRELEGLVGRTLEDQPARLRAARGLILAGGVDIVCLTLAEKGALLVTRERAWRAQAPQITPVSTVGAGDSLMGALAWSLSCGRALEEAFRCAVAAGTAALLSHGTDLSHVVELRKLMPQVEIAAV